MRAGYPHKHFLIQSSSEATDPASHLKATFPSKWLVGLMPVCLPVCWGQSSGDTGKASGKIGNCEALQTAQGVAELAPGLCEQH